MSDSETETELDAADTDGHLRKFGLRKNVLLICILLFKGIKRDSFSKLKIHPCAICGDVLKSLWAVTE